MFGYISRLFTSSDTGNDIKKDYIEELLNINDNISIKDLVKLFNSIICNDEVSNMDIFNGILYIRDYKNGKGLRDYGNLLLYIYLTSNRIGFKEEDKEYLKKILYIYLNDIGRWDDWVIFYEIDYIKDFDFINLKKNNKSEKNIKNCEEKIVLIKTIIKELICKELIHDYKKCKNNEKISLCAKWCPSEGKRLDKKIKIVYEFSMYLLNLIKNDNNFLNILEKDILENIIKSNSKHVYRHILCILRKKIDLIETHLCQMNINDKCIKKAPKGAIIYHKKELIKKGINVDYYIQNVHRKQSHSGQKDIDDEDDKEYIKIKENSLYIKKNYLEIYKKYF